MAEGLSQVEATPLEGKAGGDGELSRVLFGDVLDKGRPRAFEQAIWLVTFVRPENARVAMSVVIFVRHKLAAPVLEVPAILRDFLKQDLVC